MNGRSYAFIRFISHILRERGHKRVKRITGRTRRPLMKFREIDLIELLLRRLKPVRCLEWGMGRSTLWFPRLLNEEARWISVEHNEDWYERVRAEVQYRNTTLLLEPSTNPAWSAPDGTRLEFLDYVLAPEPYAPFDFILVDGRARAACLEEAHGWLSPDGVVVLHDANRRYLHPATQRYKYQFFFLDYRPDSGGIWLGSERGDLGDLIDASAEASFWSVFEHYGRRFRV